MLSEALEYLSYMLLMIFLVVRIDEDVVKIYDDGNVKEIRKDIVDESLECSGSVTETKRHYFPFEGSVTGLESSFPFVSLGNANQVVSVT